MQSSFQEVKSASEGMKDHVRQLEEKLSLDIVEGFNGCLEKSEAS